MSGDVSADNSGIVSPDRVRAVFQGVLRAAQQAGWTDEALEQACGVKARRIKAYRVEGKEPALSAVLSIAVVLGPRALNTVLAIIGYVAEPIEDGDTQSPGLLVAEIAKDLGIIATLAADGFNHQNEPLLKATCDDLIQHAVPFSSAGHAA